MFMFRVVHRCMKIYSEGMWGFFNRRLPIEEKRENSVLSVSSERSERVVKYIHAPTRIATLGPSAQLKDYENI